MRPKEGTRTHTYHVRHPYDSIQYTICKTWQRPPELTAYVRFIRPCLTPPTTAATYQQISTKSGITPRSSEHP